jgi:hypothetical protein
MPSLPQYAFMAWCSVKISEEQLYIYLYLYLNLNLYKYGKGKVVPVLNKAPRQDDVLGSGDIAPPILDLGNRWR